MGGIPCSRTTEARARARALLVRRRRRSGARALAPQGRGSYAICSRTTGAKSSSRAATSWCTRRDVGRASLWETSGHVDFYRESMFPAARSGRPELFPEADELPLPHANLRLEAPLLPRAPSCDSRSSGRSIATKEKRGSHGPSAGPRLHAGRRTHFLPGRGARERDRCRGPSSSREFLARFEFRSLSFTLSTRPSKSVGDDAEWRSAPRAALARAVRERGLAHDVDEGGGARSTARSSTST